MADAPRAIDTALSLVPPAVSRDELDLIKRSIAQGATDLELKLFLADNARQGVHPFDRLIHFTKRGGRYTPITSIDSMRTRAADSGEYAGSDEPRFSYAGEPPHPLAAVPVAATVTVYRLVGTPQQRYPFTATARWHEYKPPDGQDVMWRKMPHTMLAKCAEGLALRKAFPRQLAGLYAREELAGAESTGRELELDEPPPAQSWGDKPSAIGETLKQALKATEHHAAPAPEPPAAVDAPLPPQTVTITGVEPGKPGSKALGYLTHTGSAEPIAYARDLFEAVTAARVSGEPVVLEYGRSRSNLPYVKGIRTADDHPFGDAGGIDGIG